MRLLRLSLISGVLCFALSGCLAPSYLTLSNATGHEIVVRSATPSAPPVSIPINEARDVAVLSSQDGLTFQFSISSGSAVWMYSVPFNDFGMSAAPFREARRAGASRYFAKVDSLGRIFLGQSTGSGIQVAAQPRGFPLRPR
jgi:hypothetical protein